MAEDMSTGRDPSRRSPVVREHRNEEEHRLYVEREAGVLLGYVDLTTNEVATIEGVDPHVVIKAAADFLRSRADSAVGPQDWVITIRALRPVSQPSAQNREHARPRPALEPMRALGVKGLVVLASLLLLSVSLLVIGERVRNAGAGAPTTTVPIGSAGWAPASASELIARDIFERVNDERQARGAPPLIWHDGLAAIALSWSERMTSTGQYEHSPVSFREHPNFSSTGENILMGYVGAKDAHVGWMRSDGHRANLLYPDYDAVGVGVVCAHGRMWATQVFGTWRDRTTAREPVPDGPSPLVRDDEGPRCPEWLYPWFP